MLLLKCHFEVPCMKKTLCTILSILLLLGLAAGQEAFTIEHYHVRMEAAENNSYRITEVIDVNFHEERRGIFRDIPLVFDKNPVKIRSVRVPGYSFKKLREGENLRIRIGDPAVLLYGPVRYEIHYVYDVGADRLEDMDEFNHNVIGLGWDTTIRAASFEIVMPKPFDPARVNCTSGPYGSTYSGNVVWTVEDLTIKGQLVRPLRPNEGLTVALPLPEGYWVGARRHMPSLLPLLSRYPVSAAVILLAFLLWFRKGRDKRVIKVVEFAPPDNMTPSEIGYIVDGSVDPEDITALIIYWAQQGCLEIAELPVSRGSGTELQLTRLKELPSSARGYEKALFKDLFSFGTDGIVKMSDLHNVFHPSLYRAQGEVQSWFQNTDERAIFDTSADNTKVGCLTLSTGFLSGILAFIPVFLLGLRLMRTFEPRFMGVFLAFFVSMFVVVLYSMVVQQIALGSVASRIRLIVTAYFAVMLTGGIGFLALWIVRLPVLDFALPMATSFICSCFVSAMGRRTPYGDKILGRVLGFRDFLVKAEKDKLDRLFASNPQYFFDILPYAIVLRVSDKWARHFDGLALQPPTWYRGYGHDRFNSRDFTRTLGTSVAVMSSTMRSAPSSSSGSGGSSGSSSSGGFSGGGSGGGGGGSW